MAVVRAIRLAGGRGGSSVGVEFEVPRYFFHFSDGRHRFSDTVGHELRGLAAARRHAVAQARDLKAAMCAPNIQDLAGWSMTVADARGRTVFEIGLDLKPGGEA